MLRGFGNLPLKDLDEDSCRPTVGRVKAIYQQNGVQLIVNDYVNLAGFRNHVVQLGITSMSAESKTNPGGYVVEPQSLEQFEISDERSTEDIVAMLQAQGLEVVWKDWESFKSY